MADTKRQTFARVMALELCWIFMKNEPVVPLIQPNLWNIRKINRDFNNLLCHAVIEKPKII